MKTKHSKKEKKESKSKHKKKKKEKKHKKKKLLGELGITLAEKSKKEVVKKETSESCQKIYGAMTKEQYEKEKNTLKRVYDPETGRNRNGKSNYHSLVKGDGEIVEEIVSKKRHNQIKKIATKNDGLFYAEKAKYLAFLK